MKTNILPTNPGNGVKSDLEWPAMISWQELPDSDEVGKIPENR